MRKGSIFSKCLPASVISYLLNNNHPNKCKVIPRGFGISLIIGDVEQLFVYLLTISIFSLEKCLLKSFVHFKIGLFGYFCLFVVFAIQFYEFLIYFGYKTLTKYMVCKYFSYSVGRLLIVLIVSSAMKV